MITDIIQIMNLSCKGCVNTITKNISRMDGVQSVDIDLETDIVTVVHEVTISREKITEQLQALGYPEVNHPNSFITKLKSKKSCMIGRIS